ncbi:hypothetical protein ACOME3_006460 [Neoechinorhynchus agilis]
MAYGLTQFIKTLPANFNDEYQYLNPMFPKLGSTLAFDQTTWDIDLFHRTKTIGFSMRYEILTPWSNSSYYQWIVHELNTMKGKIVSGNYNSSIGPLCTYFQNVTVEGHYRGVDGLKDAVDLLVENEAVPSDDYFYTRIVPLIVDSALEATTLFDSTNRIPALYKWCDIALTLSGRQCLCLISHCFLNTFERLGTYRVHPCHPEAPEQHTISQSRMNPFTFWKMMTASGQPEKLACYLGYMVHQLKNMDKLEYGVTFYRARIPRSPPSILKTFLDQSPGISRTAVTTKLLTDDFATCLQVDFADEYVGGESLRYDMAQEEVIFCLRPELLVSMLFTTRLQDREALQMTGARIFNDTDGYSDKFEYTGPNLEDVPMDGKRRFTSNITAIDAIHFQANNVNEQYDMANIDREILKAVVGFAHSSRFQNTWTNAISTGKWGSGIFNANLELKFVIQLLAASITGRHLIYCSFHDTNLSQRIANFCNQVAKMRPKQIYQILENNELNNYISVFDLIVSHAKYGGHQY